MLQKKKLGLFISHIYGEYQRNLCQGVVRQAEEYGYRTEIYFTNDGEDLGTYAKGEESIMNIPNLADLDGIIFASGTYSQPTLEKKLRHMLKKQTHCKVVDISEMPTDFPAVSMENNLTAGTLTEHLISVHSAKRICFLGLGKDNYYSNQRLKAYETVMARHLLTVADNDVVILDENISVGDALDIFTDNGNQTLDAVVCYNDEIALDFWSAAFEKGYDVPKDFAITGCDYSEAAQNVTPPLTTVTFPSYQVGAAAVDLLVKLAKGGDDKLSTVFAEPVFGGSCGCNYHRSDPGFMYDRMLTNRIANLENSMFISMKMAADFAHVTDVDDGMDLLEQYVSYIDDCKEFYLCLYSDWDNITSQALQLAEENEDFDVNPSSFEDDNMLLKLALRDGKRLPECSYSKTSLLPEYLQKDSDSSYIVCPLFFEDRVFGYVAMAFEDNRMNFQFKLVHWVMNITQLLQSLCEAKHTQALAKHLEDIYLRDVLTGLYNHHGFIRQENAMLKEAQAGDYITTIIIDLDLLKTINDHFGHQEGDFALRAIGQAIQQASREGDICARFSGDEFFVLLKGKKADNGQEFVARVESYLNNFNKLSSKPYNISISAGSNTIAYTEDIDTLAIDTSFDRADENMYEIKKTKTKNVLR